MLPSLLILDDEIEVTKALVRLLRKDYDIVAFTDAREALEHFNNSPTHLVISDLMMPDINGADFLKEIAQRQPRTKRIALTGYANANLAQQAINEGNISFYMSKPWDNDDLKHKLATLVDELKTENKKHRRLKSLTRQNTKLQRENQIVNWELTDEDDKVELLAHIKQIKSANKSLLLFIARLISLYTQEPQGFSNRIALQAKAFATYIGLSASEANGVYWAALLHRVGIIGIEEGVRQSDWHSLSVQDKKDARSFVVFSAEMLDQTPALKGCSTIIRHIYENMDGSGFPDGLVASEIPTTSKILRIVNAFNWLVSGDRQIKPIEPEKAFVKIKSKIGYSIEGTLYHKFYDFMHEEKTLLMCPVAKPVRELRAGMILSEDLFDLHDHLLLGEGTKLEDNHINRLLKTEQVIEHNLVVFVEA